MPARIILLFATAIFIFSAFVPQSHAQSDKKATHMWMDAGYSPTYIPVRTLRECELMTRQAAILDNDAESHCYDNNTFIGGFDCEKGRKIATNTTCENIKLPSPE